MVVPSSIEMIDIGRVWIKKKTPKKSLKFYSHNVLLIKTSKFQLHSCSFQPKLFQYFHLYTTSTALNLYTTQTVSIHPTPKIPNNHKLFQNPYINQAVSEILILNNLLLNLYINQTVSIPLNPIRSKNSANFSWIILYIKEFKN